MEGHRKGSLPQVWKTLYWIRHRQQNSVINALTGRDPEKAQGGDYLSTSGWDVFEKQVTFNQQTRNGGQFV